VFNIGLGIQDMMILKVIKLIQRTIVTQTLSIETMIVILNQKKKETIVKDLLHQISTQN